MATSKNAREFKLDLDKAFNEEVSSMMLLVTQKLAMEALNRVVMKSPVDTGRFRGNWNVSFGTPTAGPDLVDKTGSEVITRGNAVIMGMKVPMTVWVSNHLPYAEALENGHSQQAPAGVVAVTFEELKQIVPVS